MRQQAGRQPAGSATPVSADAGPDHPLLAGVLSTTDPLGSAEPPLSTSDEPVTAGLDGEGSDKQASFIGLFHLVNNLVPNEQAILAVQSDTSVREALNLMREHGFSQLPIVESEQVLGVFSYRSFANRAAILGKVDLGRAEVDDFIEDFEFVRVTDELERTFPHLDRDGAVLVGDPDKLIAVATPTDLIDYMYGLLSFAVFGAGGVWPVSRHSRGAGKRGI